MKKLNEAGQTGMPGIVLSSDQLGLVERLRNGEAPLADPNLNDEAADEIERLREKYNELLYAVGNKHADETRHETALRYIKQAERSVSTGQQSVSGPNVVLTGARETGGETRC